MRAFIASFGYAARGVGRAVRAERNFRFELCAAVYVLLACPFFGFAPAEWALVFLCIGGVLALELVNSAIERAVEDPDPAHWRPAGAAKDMAAGAVLAAGLAALAAGLALFWRPEGWLALFGWLATRPAAVAALAVSLPAAGWFVFGMEKKG